MQVGAPAGRGRCRPLLLSEAKPEWTISRESFMMTWAAFRQSLQRYERGLLA